MTNGDKIDIIEFCDKMDILWRPIRLEIKSKNDGTYIKNLCDDLNSGHKPKPNDFADADWLKNKLAKCQQKITADYYTHIAIDTSKIYNLDVDWLEGKAYTPEAKKYD